MTAYGHYITSLSMGVSGGMMILGTDYGSDWVTALADTIRWSADVTVNGIYYAPTCVIALCFFIGSAMGAWAPDWMEGVLFINGDRRSLIPHRTLTHTVAIWVCLVAGAGGLIYWVDVPWTYMMAWLFLGFALAGLLHVVIDMLSPTGVPVVKPFGARVSFRVYRTGGISELLVIFPVILVSVVLVRFL